MMQMTPRIDLTNKRFGQLTVQEWLPGLRLSRSSLTWLCKCTCGATVPITRDALRGGLARRCPTCQAARNAQATQQKRATMQREPIRKDPPEPTLEQGIAEALWHKRVSSETLSAVFNQAADALLDAEQLVNDTQAKKLDPTVLDDTRSALDEAIWRRDKLQGAVSALRTKHQQILTQERKAQWNVEADAIEARRDELTEVFASTYPEIISQLIELFARVKEMDAEVDQINRQAPDSEERRLLKVGIRGDLSVNTRLVGLSGQPMWPVSAPILPEQVMPILPGPGADWHETLAQRDRERYAESQRVAAYYANQAREQEQREAAAKARRGNGASP
jgi:hypothetical protein